MTTPESEAEIVRLHYVEHWKVGTIATQLGLHPDVVRRVLGIGAARPGASQAARPSLVDPYRALVADTLRRYPRLCATRLHDMLRERGYRGAVRTLREYVATVRPRPHREVYLRTEPLPGEQSQIDWAYIGTLPVPGGERALWLFVMVLSHSRALWGEFVFDLTVHSLCRSLVRAATAFGGVTRQWLFDNPKVVVLERRGDAVRFHPTLYELCASMRVQPRLCAVARPEHKGKVERAIRYLRDRFLAGRTILDIASGNRELLRFVDEIAHARPHPVLPHRRVGDVLSEERRRLLGLPDPLPATDLVMPLSVDRQAFVRFDTNRYSVPPAQAESTVTLVADDQTVRVLDGQTEVARHERNYGRRQIIELDAHRAAILKLRRAAADLKGRDRLRAVAPGFHILLERWALSGPSLGLQVTRAIQLLDLYGDDIFARAVEDLVARGLRDTSALALACEKLRRARSRPVPVDINLPEHVVEIDRDVVPHDLDRYDD